ncbi:hypothetical protein N9L31_00030 [bacterium]|nr:hypothetical protein [bacterium]
MRDVDHHDHHTAVQTPASPHVLEQPTPPWGLSSVHSTIIGATPPPKRPPPPPAQWHTQLLDHFAQDSGKGIVPDVETAIYANDTLLGAGQAFWFASANLLFVCACFEFRVLSVFFLPQFVVCSPAPVNDDRFIRASEPYVAISVQGLVMIDIKFTQAYLTHAYTSGTQFQRRVAQASKLL